MPPENEIEFARALGRVEQAVTNLNETIKDFSGKLKPVTDGITKHHDRLKDGDIRMDALSSKLKYGLIACFAWLFILTALKIPIVWTVVSGLLKIKVNV